MFKKYNTNFCCTKCTGHKKVAIISHFVWSSCHFCIKSIWWKMMIKSDHHFESISVVFINFFKTWTHIQKNCNRTWVIDISFSLSNQLNLLVWPIMLLTEFNISYIFEAKRVEFFFWIFGILHSLEYVHWFLD